VYADREVVTVRSEVLFLAGGGGPHCITQQVPSGTFAP
jgi:agmatine/peptidylarginine deiminase